MQLEQRGMEPVPSFLPRDLLVELELCVNLYNFVNIDLHNQGWYAVRVRPVADNAWIELPVFGVVQNESVERPPQNEDWVLEDGKKSFRSRLIRVKYCLEQAPLGHAVCFHLLHPLQEGLDGVSCTLEFELLFQLADVAREVACPKPNQLKSVAREFIRIGGVHRGVHEYLDVTFDQDHFALCNATVHSRLVAITTISGLDWHRQGGPKPVAIQEPARANSFSFFYKHSTLKMLPAPPSGRCSPGSPKSSVSRSSVRYSFTSKRVGESDEAAAALREALVQYLTPKGGVDLEFIGQAQTLYAASTGILARSAECLSRWLHSLPKGCYAPMSLEGLRNFIKTQQQGFDKSNLEKTSASAEGPRSFADRASVAASHKGGASPLTSSSNPPAATREHRGSAGMLSARSSLHGAITIQAHTTSGDLFLPPSPLDFWSELPEPYSAGITVSKLCSIWNLLLEGLRSDWALLVWMLRANGAEEVVKTLKGQWEEKQYLDASHWLVHGEHGAQEKQASCDPAQISMQFSTPRMLWRVSLGSKQEVCHVRDSLKSGMNLTIPRVHKPAVWDHPHRNPLLVVDSALASHMPEAPASRSLKDANGKDGPADSKECWVAVFVHGFQGAATDLCLVKAQMQIMWPKLEVLSSKANEDKTFDSIENMGKRLADEMCDFLAPFANSYRRPLGRIIIVGHSIGNLIVRAALTCPEFQPYLKNLWLYISISGPHLGWIYNNNKLMDTGVGLLKMVSGGKSLSELTFTDHKDMKECYLYKLAKTGGLRHFPYVVVMSSPQDKYIPLHSAQIAMCDAARKDHKKGKHYEEMVNALMDGIGEPGKTQLFRVDVEFRYRKTEKLRFGTWLGRTAHIDFIETDMYVKLLLWGLLWRHKLMPEFKAAWI